MPRIHKDRVSDVRHPNEIALKKIGWVMAYWNGVEHLNVAECGFVEPFAGTGAAAGAGAAAGVHDGGADVAPLAHPLG